ncbi:DUF4124 domain-containing protein [Salicola sp. Rm-C-2C1-2]|uniref:DUF4124 domain-containing protein n=1 Tax=Salicola sp. Rm-C-2C1-2 TaxID=3141321 RepID=UPI0032E4FE74
MMRIAHYISLLAALAVALPASAEIYRWTNQAGETSFGSNPPAGVDAQPVSPKTTNTFDGGSQANNSDDNSTDKENGNKKTDQERQAIRRKNCEAARQALKTLDQNARVQVMEDGERRYLSPKEKAAERKRYEKIRDKNCE